MLSVTARPYIQASVPVLREHGLSITRHFYQTMLDAHPELKNLFNLGNQANGEQQQALAAAVFAYAANIDNRQALAPVLSRIAHKHVAVGLKASHYPIVGQYLLGAIAHVLGAQASPPLLDAWAEAYWLLAAELIHAEAELYAAGGQAAGSFQSVNVVKRVQESEDVLSFYLQSADGRSPGQFAPGQYISVVQQIGELRQLRQYSLSDADNQDYWRISVKHERGNTAQNQVQGMVSSQLHAGLQVGDKVLVSMACGDFTPLQNHAAQQEQALVLISAGIGITPMISVLNTLAAQGSPRPVHFIHAAKDGAHQPFRAELEAARARLPHLRTHIAHELAQGGQAGVDYDAGGLLRLQEVLSDADLGGSFYLCGPRAFMQAQSAVLAGGGVKPEQIRREVFGPELLEHLL